MKRKLEKLTKALFAVSVISLPINSENTNKSGSDYKFIAEDASGVVVQFKAKDSPAVTDTGIALIEVNNNYILAKSYTPSGRYHKSTYSAEVLKRLSE